MDPASRYANFHHFSHYVRFPTHKLDRAFRLNMPSQNARESVPPTPTGATALQSRNQIEISYYFYIGITFSYQCSLRAAGYYDWINVSYNRTEQNEIEREGNKK